MRDIVVRLAKLGYHVVFSATFNEPTKLSIRRYDLEVTLEDVISSQEIMLALHTKLNRAMLEGEKEKAHFILDLYLYFQTECKSEPNDLKTFLDTVDPVFSGDNSEEKDIASEMEYFNKIEEYGENAGVAGEAVGEAVATPVGDPINTGAMRDTFFREVNKNE